jgi:hypothetical protein
MDIWRDMEGLAMLLRLQTLDWVRPLRHYDTLDQ